MNFRTDNSGRRASLDMTPMIDVVFNLLLFFVVATFMAGRQGIKVNLPQAETAKEERVTKRSEVTITADLKIYINDTQVGIEGLFPGLVKEETQSVDKTLLIRADGVVPHSLVMNVMDEATKAGFFKLSFAAKKGRN